MSGDYETFKSDILEFAGINLNCYKEEQMKRRISTLIERKSLNGYDEYFKSIKNNRSDYEEFLSYMTINVSEFFRNPEQWDVLEKDLLPELLRNHNRKLTIWSAACSTGDEPYSLVMLLSKYMAFEDIEIIATDIDASVLDKARIGLYSGTSVKNVPKEFLDRFFTRIGENTYKIDDTVKRCVHFRQHDIIKDPYPKDIDLLLCRNVLIYFTEAAKTEIYKKFYKNMSEKSVLFIGSTEQIIKYREIGYKIYKSFFYKKD